MCILDYSRGQKGFTRIDYGCEGLIATMSVKGSVDTEYGAKKLAQPSTQQNNLLRTTNPSIKVPLIFPASPPTDVFLTYLTRVLLPQLWQGAIVVMDHLKVHHAHAVRLAIEALGARVIFLPPYFPNLSPIELC